MKFLTDKSDVECQHKAPVQLVASQQFVTISKRPVQVENDPEGRDINGCQNNLPLQGINPCRQTLKVQAGYSTFIRIGGHAVCLDTVTGLTNGTPPGNWHYSVVSPEQDFVSGVA
jgi:hypothetical protein